VAAVRAGRRFLGVEMNQEYLELASRRIRALEGAPAVEARAG
jgi:DNA modification methylase